MNDLLLLIDKLPELMLYLIQGYVFIFIFDYIAFSKGHNDIKHLFFKSVVSSYILKLTFDFLCEMLMNVKINNICYDYYILQWLDNTYFYVFGLIIFSSGLAYIISKCIFSAVFNKFLEKLRISRNTYNNIWLDIKDDNYAVWITVFDEKQKRYYVGTLKFFEDSVREPITILTRYQVLDEKKKIIEDNSMDYQRRLVLNMAEYKKIELFYNEESSLISSEKEIINKLSKLQNSGIISDSILNE